ncbi:hypothetical protein ABIE91_007693 [Bradyrhizobium elkanii]
MVSESDLELVSGLGCGQRSRDDAIGYIVRQHRRARSSRDNRRAEDLRIRFYFHQNFPGNDFRVSKIKVMQACLNEIQNFIVRGIGAFAVLEYHHSYTDAIAPIQYVIGSESVRFP